MTEHVCPLPAPVPDSEYTCPDCKQDWFVIDDHCRSCGHSEGPRWTKFGIGDGTFPKVSADRGGIVYRTT